MVGVEAKSMDSPDEVRTPEKTNVDVVSVGGTEVGRFTFQPGFGYALSGRIQVEHEDGTSVEIRPGDAYLIKPGHDAWVVGDEPFVGVEFKSAGEYAR